MITQVDGSVIDADYPTEGEARMHAKKLAERGVWLTDLVRLAWQRIDAVDVAEV